MIIAGIVSWISTWLMEHVSYELGITFILLCIAGFIVLVTWANDSIKKEEKEKALRRNIILEGLEKRLGLRKIFTSLNYYILFGDEYFGLLPVMDVEEYIRNTKVEDIKSQDIEEKIIRITKINDIKVYIDSQEESWKNALKGGLVLGVVGAVAGANAVKKYIESAGIKLYTNEGFFNIGFLSGSKIEFNSPDYHTLMNKIDTFYNELLKIKNKEIFS
ncbi:hypothetical protein [Caldicellulosiruptor acetigenus]|uniref:hypothetical protein n=1 Tax=Caldicellulosiruptor acetigenus TaxID=301953 RepID=UPI0011D08BDE|nr:hypothetical protein [Caldicellulosiruptor acetigenus]